jgi:FtsP/CotA-like multicopper oxidase with cupredoxin domain
VRRLVIAGGGALALLPLLLLVGWATASGASGTTREYWIAAVPLTWNVVPNEHNAIEHEHFTAEKTTMRTIVYRAFTKDFAQPIPPDPGNEGLQGPLIHATVGDTVLVHFRNLDPTGNHPHSMHFHAFEYAPGSDGAFIPGFSGPGANVKPGQEFTYRLKAGENSAGVWPYHDHSMSMSDSIAGGMYGAISIAPRGERPPDREFVVFLSTHLGFMTIDGRAFVGNTPVFHARVGDTVQWDVLTLGDDFHTFHVHGHRWLSDAGTPLDTRVLGPAESFRVRWVEDAPGTWLYHCHVESHMMNGMIGIYRVTKRGAAR